MLWAQSTTKDYIRAEYKFHSIPRLFIPQVIIPQVMFFEPIYIPRTLNTGTCPRQGDLFSSGGLHRNHVLATANTGKKSGDFWEEKNASEWTWRVEISKEEIPGSKRGIYGYILTYSRLERENLKAVQWHSHNMTGFFFLYNLFQPPSIIFWNIPNPTDRTNHNNATYYS